MFKEKEYWAETFESLVFNDNDIKGIEFDDCTFKNCDFKGMEFKQCRFIDCHFKQCDMNVVKFMGSRFEGTAFEDSKLTGVDWTLVDYSEFIQEAPFSFVRCVLDYSSFFGEKLENLVIKKSSVVEVDFREATLVGANFSESDLSESQFRHTDLSSSDFRDATSYTIDLRINTITGAKFSRDEAISLLESLEITLV